MFCTFGLNRLNNVYVCYNKGLRIKAIKKKKKNGILKIFTQIYTRKLKKKYLVKNSSFPLYRSPKPLAYGTILTCQTPLTGTSNQLLLDKIIQFFYKINTISIFFYPAPKNVCSRCQSIR